MVDSWRCHNTSVLVRLSLFFRCRQRQGDSEMWVLVSATHRRQDASLELKLPMGLSIVPQPTGLHDFLQVNFMGFLAHFNRYSQTLPNTVLQDCLIMFNPWQYFSKHSIFWNPAAPGVSSDSLALGTPVRVRGLEGPCNTKYLMQDPIWSPIIARGGDSTTSFPPGDE